MASSAFTPPQPPASLSPEGQAAPTSPPAASPAPPSPSPGLQSSTQDIIDIVRKLRGLAKQFPEAAPLVSQMNDLMRQVVAVTMKHQKMQEPPAPPM